MPLLKQNVDARERSRSYRLGNALIEGFISWGWFLGNAQKGMVIGPFSKRCVCVGAIEHSNSLEDSQGVSKTLGGGIFFSWTSDAAADFVKTGISLN